MNLLRSEQLIRAAAALRSRVDKLAFGPPVTHVYNPLVYAWAAHREYLTRFGNSRKRVLFLGMNPGPFGMAQTGVPFGDVGSVRDWLGISTPVKAPGQQHAKRPVLGFDCLRSEVSGRRLWGLFARQFGTPERFFQNHFVVNYCPLLFVEDTGRNRTPDKLPAAEAGPLFAACDAHLQALVTALEPEWVIGIGRFAEQQAKEVLTKHDVKIGTVLHPSPASPASNRDWEGTATRQLIALGVWAPDAPN